MPGTSHDELFEALSRLRASTPERLSYEDADWRIVERWLRETYGRSVQADDLIQETMIAILRRVSSLEAQHPGAAVRWVQTIHKRKLIDLVRNDARAPARAGLARVATEEAPAPVDLLERDDARIVDGDAERTLVEAVEGAIGEHVEKTYANAIDRQLRRVQARTTLYRMLGHDIDGLREVVGLGPEVGRDRIYKWVERGRPVLLAALEPLRAEASEDAEPLIDALMGLVSTRRVDVGQPRGGRATGEKT